MIGTLINAASIIAGGLLGLLLKKIVPERINSILMVDEGIAILVIALNGVLTRMITVENGALSSSGELLLLISLVLGTTVGELIDIDNHINNAAVKIEKKLHINGFSEGFVSASLIFCIGAMTIMGPMNEVLEGDMTLLLIKSFLDGVTGLTLAVVLGYGVIFAFVPVILVQGFAALLAVFMSSVSPVIISDVCMVGFSLLICLGLNFAVGTKIKTANMLPSMLVPVVYHLIF